MGNDLSSAGSTLPTLPTAAQTTKAMSGSHLLHITGYSYMRGLGVGKHFSSTSFSIGGCSWTIQFYPDGASEADKQYISFGLTLCGGAMTSHALVDFTLIDWQTIPRRDTETKLSCHNFWRGDVCIVNFVERESFEASDYLKNDDFKIQCTVTVMKLPRGNDIAQSITIPPCKLRQQLRDLLASGLGADVTFKVGTEFFHAHRCVLAASSPVFRAHLFGPMKEKNMKCITIEEIESPVFRAMLNFIYTDMISHNAVDKQHFLSSHKELCWMHQHLLVAADRFGLDRLRSTCEFLLCRNFDKDNVSAALALAEQHNCGQLKVACLKYMASRKILKAVMATDGFRLLESRCPRLVEKMKTSCRTKTRGVFNDSLPNNAFILFVCSLWIVVGYFGFT